MSSPSYSTMKNYTSYLIHCCDKISDKCMQLLKEVFVLASDSKRNCSTWHGRQATGAEGLWAQLKKQRGVKDFYPGFFFKDPSPWNGIIHEVRLPASASLTQIISHRAAQRLVTTQSLTPVELTIMINCHGSTTSSLVPRVSGKNSIFIVFQGCPFVHSEQ